MELEIKEKPPASSRGSFRIYGLGLAISLVITTTILVLNIVFSKTFMDSSIQFSILLQKVNIKAICFVFSYVIFFIVFAYVFFLYTIRDDIERNLIMLLSVSMLIYLQAIIKLLFVEARPIFLSADIDGASCTCDYGQPSGHSFTSAGLFLIIFNDLRVAYRPRLAYQIVLGLCFLLVTLSIGFSRIWFGVHSYNQVALGFGFGVSIFFAIKLLRDPLKKHFFGPIWRKGHYADSWALLNSLGFFIVTHAVLFLLWAIRHWNWEATLTERISFRNCFECLANISAKFATKIYSEGLVFNAFFGMLFGIYCMRGPIYEWRGLYFDAKPWNYCLRILLLALFASPAIFIKLPASELPAVEILRSGLISFLVGYLITHPYVIAMRKLTMKIEHESYSQFEDLENQGQNKRPGNELAGRNAEFDEKRIFGGYFQNSPQALASNQDDWKKSQGNSGKQY